MKLVDLNLLIYAVNRDSPDHARAKSWIDRTLSGGESVAFAWIVLLGFVRLVTHPRLMPKPLALDAAMSVVDGWLAVPGVIVLGPGAEHWRILRQLLSAGGTGGNLTTDAHLAALAIEHGCELCSADGDFSRFAGLRWINPLAA